MISVFLYNEDTGYEKKYKSVSEAARILGIPQQKIHYALKSGGKLCGYLVRSFSVDSQRVSLEYDIPREELDRPHYARIDGKLYTAVKCDNKTKCTECDIFKLAPPKSWIQKPLCYDYNCGTHKIVDVCSRYKCIWKRKKEG